MGPLNMPGGDVCARVLIVSNGCPTMTCEAPATLPATRSVKGMDSGGHAAAALAVAVSPAAGSLMAASGCREASTEGTSVGGCVQKSNKAASRLFQMFEQEP